MPYRQLCYYQIQIVSIAFSRRLLCYSRLWECLQSTTLEAFQEIHHRVCSALKLGHLAQRCLKESFVDSFNWFSLVISFQFTQHFRCYFISNCCQNIIYFWSDRMWVQMSSFPLVCFSHWWYLALNHVYYFPRTCLPHNSGLYQWFKVLSWEIIRSKWFVRNNCI